jgi:hypothetical protein
MINKQGNNTPHLSEKALENLQRNNEFRLVRRTNGLLTLNDGEDAIRIFDPEQIDITEIDYEGKGKKVQKFDYTVRDPKTGEIQIFRVSNRTSGDIDALLMEGYRLLKVRREGTGKNTRYYVTPVKEV